MAKKVKAADVPSNGVAATYPWADWFDGDWWELRRNVDFSIKPGSFAGRAIVAGKARDLKVTTRVRGDTVYMRAVRAT